jgi:ER lumen protein retaining receptor
MESVILWTFEGGYLFQHTATFFQILKMTKRQNSECVSLETNILFLIGAFSRVFWISKSTLSELFITYVELLSGFLTLGYAIYLHEKNKVRNYFSNEIKLPIYLKLYVLLPLIVILSFFFNPGQSYFTEQIFVSIGIFSEAIGILPQLYIIRKSKDTGDLSELYVVFLAVSRFLRLFFWITMFISGERYFSLIIADIIHSLALSNFVYNVIKNWSGKGLPTSFAELQSNSGKKMF